MLSKEYENHQEGDHEHHAGCSHDHDRHAGSGGGHVARSGGSKIFRLNKIIEDLRERLPVNAEAPSEEITIPGSEEFEGYTKDNVVHVDGFLYTEDDVDELCDAGTLSRNYCQKCGSKDTKPLNFISHSASVVQLQFLFQVVLKDRVNNKVVLDVGSRLGAVLYAGHLFTEAKKLIGVEMNDYFCKLQTEIVRKHRLQDRIEIIHDNLLNRASLLQGADIIIMNNVFQFFCPLDIQRQLWEFLYTNLRHRKGALLVTIPSLQEQLKDAGFVESSTKKPKNKKKKVPAKPPGVIAAQKEEAAAADETAASVGNWSSWLREIEVKVTGEEFVEDIMEDELEELKLIHVYEVI
ncbi:hypothetical protein BC939DRAFT_160963 [Gamsiella multidivaricata]|uniref:uncharacterized protein n=1 Tax=Gamsiella multidivaricata TaxID=101098 RepID=UPI002220543C|nr:uncharacterized protein BC939DRAFT_160963 [Gamsiella multidivaricata]KAI7823598.1 hypothetical protein BC939DRAFT_160963 [Gamsiella multidivaricata]